ncbi:MAG TPA: glycosyltransferase family 4 protein [Candidatus Eremiobacteraceae bacterium]|nr:glycosyltransferase family 4 protein [Candidatus Eremiobacteraceae bacterium]
MRILMSIHQDLDPKTGTGGVTCHLANALRRRGHAVDILSFEQVSAPDRVKTYLYPWFVASFIAKHPYYDVVDLSSRDGWVLSALQKVSPRKSTPVVIARSHGLEHLLHEARLDARRSGALKLSWAYPIYKGGFRLWECRTSLSLANAALFLNFTERRYAVERLGVDPSRAVRVRNGIGDCFVQNAKSLLNCKPSADSPKNIASIGRYSDLKGAQYLRAAMRSVLSKNPKSTMGLFGTMVDRNSVLAEYPSEIRNRIHVVPAYENDQLPKLLAGYHVLAFPSLFEGFAVAPLEAMACGLVPVVAATPGPMSYIESGHNGILVPPRDANALEREIARLLDDAPRWNALRRGGLATAMEHSWDDVASDTEKIYEQFAAAPSYIHPYRLG